MTPRDPSGNRDAPVWRRLGWFVALWTASVAALGVVGYAIKAMIG